MIELRDCIVGVKDVKEYEKVIQIAKEQGCEWNSGDSLDYIYCPFPGTLFFDKKGKVTSGPYYEKYKSICNQDATDSIIAPLVEKYGDKSNGGMVTYRKVYKKMGEMSPINWHNLEVRYINKHGKAGARRKKIISSNPEMLRKFKNAVDVMMVG